MIELLENGNITFDAQAAKADGLNPEILNEIMSLTDNGKNQNDGISTFDFTYPFFHYGNYCGKDSVGGIPIDNLDRACRAHDLCFKGLNDTSSANKRCNRNLVRSALPIVQATNSHSAEGITARIAVTVFSKRM